MKKIIIPNSHFQRKQCFDLFNNTLTGDNIMALELQYNKPLSLIEHEWMREACRQDIVDSEKNKTGIIVYIPNNNVFKKNLHL